MRGFKLNSAGDIEIAKGKIVFTSGNDLIRQSIETVLRTNNGEWFLKENEGIGFYRILTKNPAKDAIRSEVLAGLRQVNENFAITAFDMDLNGRALKITFSANDGESTITGGVDYVR